MRKEWGEGEKLRKKEGKAVMVVAPGVGLENPLGARVKSFFEVHRITN